MAKKNPPPAASAPKRAEHADFFIGYKRVPVASRRFFLLAVPLLLAGGTSLGVLFARAQTRPAASNWGKRPIELRGQLIKQPYPHLLVANNYAAEGYDAVFLVQRGKKGAQQLVSEMKDSYVQVRGKLITRHDERGNYLFEAVGMKEERRNIPIDSLATPLDLGMRVLRGRIVDSKCYFGVMKPAAGLTHKACASLCIRGGIPPLFVPYGAKTDRVIVITDENGEADAAALLPYVLDPVEVRGQLVAINNHYQLRLAPNAIKALVSIPC